jgi:hypothetical protein
MSGGRSISLPLSAFKNNNMQNALINKLNAVISDINAGNYSEALGKLQNDILGKVSGKTTWFKDPQSQAAIYDLIMSAIEELEVLNSP